MCQQADNELMFKAGINEGNWSLNKHLKRTDVIKEDFFFFFSISLRLDTAKSMSDIEFVLDWTREHCVHR